MAEIGDWGLVGAAFVIGATLGSWVTLRVTRAHFATRLQNAGAELTKRHAMATNELRAANVRAQNELEQTRASFKRQLATASEAPRAAVQRAEERLQAAYDELDRLRGTSGSPTRTKPAATTHGFATTEVLDTQR
jgi:hypothetical protein